MFMDDHTLAQIAPSGDFGNTFTINCDNPLMAPRSSAVSAIREQPDQRLPRQLPARGGAPYNPNPGAAPIDFFDPLTGQTYNKAYFQLLRRNTEGGPRIADLKHTSYRGVLGMRGDLGNVWSYDAYFHMAGPTIRWSTRTSSRRAV